MGGELTGAGSRAMGQPGSRGELEWQLRTADVLKKGGRLSGSEAGSQSRDARSVDYQNPMEPPPCIFITSLISLLQFLPLPAFFSSFVEK